MAAKFGVTVVSQPHAGPAAARNRGARLARNELLLFTDADCQPAPDWVVHLSAPFADPAVAGARGEYRSRQPEIVARFVQQEYRDRYDRLAGLAQIDFVDTYSAAYRRDVFLATGGFDAGFPTASVEDQEFSFRLAAAGHRLVAAPRAVVFHRHNRTLRAYFCRKFHIGYWKVRAMRRHPAKLARDSHTPQRLKAEMALAGLGGLLALSRRTRPGALAAWLLLLLLELPLYRKILQRDAPVLGAAPLLVFARGWALGLGFLLGALRWAWTNDEKHQF